MNGRRMHDLMAELFPLCRSITGDGLRRTFDILGGQIHLDRHETPSGTPVFDWTVPREWNIREAWVKDPAGKIVIDFAEHNLAVLGYSIPVRRRMPLSELRPHLFTLPEHPDWVPYRTSYYSENWGFCLSHNQLRQLEEGEYEVCIDSSLRDGHLTYAEHRIPGTSEHEVLISCHTCHPSLANDNLSSIAVAVALAHRIAARARRFSYRFVFLPGTIGSITWLSQHEAETAKIRHGLVLACLGDPGPLTYKQSRRGDAAIDRVAELTLRQSGRPHRITPFSPYGYDERQYCSPGFDLPVGSLTRTPHGQFPEYHTSADNLSFVGPEFLEDSLEACWEIVSALEADQRYRNLKPFCEPQLGRRGLYGAIGGRSDAEARQMAMLWVLNLSDGRHSLVEIAERSGVALSLLAEVAAELVGAELLAAV